MEAEGARMGHLLEHISVNPWAMIGGMLGGALVLGLLAAATIATGGLVGAVIIGAAAAGGASIGGTIAMRYATRPPMPTGPIIMPCSLDVFYEDISAAHVFSMVACTGIPGTPVPHPAMQVAEGSTSVLINGMMAARKGGKTTCGAAIGEGCPSIIIGGETGIGEGLTIKSELAFWEGLIKWTGIVGLVGLLFVPLSVAIGALALGILGGLAGDFLGGMWFGEGSDGQFWMTLGGGFLGAIFGAKVGGRFGGRSIAQMLGWQKPTPPINSTTSLTDEAANIADDAANIADDAANIADDAANIADDAANVADDAVNQARTWQEHETLVTNDLTTRNPNTTVGDQITLDVTGPGANGQPQTVRIRIDNLHDTGSNYQLTDAKFSAVSDLTNSSANLRNTFTPNQRIAYSWITNGQATSVVPAGARATAMGLQVGQPINVNPSINVGVNSPSGVTYIPWP